MVVTSTGKVLGVSKPKTKVEREMSQPTLISNYAWDRISEIRKNKIIKQLCLLMQTRQLERSSYTKKDVWLLISDIQYELDIVEDYLLRTAVDSYKTEETEIK